MIWNFVVQILIAVALTVVAYLLMPKPKRPKPPAAKDMDGPTAEAGRPIPVIFGTITIKGVNCLWYGDKRMQEYEIKVKQ